MPIHIIDKSHSRNTFKRVRNIQAQDESITREILYHPTNFDFIDDEESVKSPSS